MRYIALIPLVLAILVVSCSSQQQQNALPQNASMSAAGKKNGPSGKIQHVVIIFQENRTPDDLFQALASEGANVQSWGMNGTERVNLKETSLATSYESRSRPQVVPLRLRLRVERRVRFENHQKVPNASIRVRAANRSAAVYRHGRTVRLRRQYVSHAASRKLPRAPIYHQRVGRSATADHLRHLDRSVPR